MTVLITILSGEGGMHADELVLRQYAIYKKFEARQCL